MAKKSKHQDGLPEIVGASGETPVGKVWASVHVTLRLGDYESVTVELGQSFKINGNKGNRDAARVALLTECEQEVVDKAVEVKNSWRERT